MHRYYWSLTSLIIFISFWITHWGLFHLPIFSNELLFYRGIKLLIINSLLWGGGFLFIVPKKFLSLRERFLLLVSAFSLSLTFFVLFPVTFERSLSMFVLYSAEQKSIASSCKEGFNEEDIEKLLIDKYIKAMNSAERRVYEQLQTGFFRYDSAGCLHLTPKAYRFIKLSKIINRLYDIQQTHYFDVKHLRKIKQK